jgi:hypothetical protein
MSTPEQVFDAAFAAVSESITPCRRVIPGFGVVHTTGDTLPYHLDPTLTVIELSKIANLAGAITLGRAVRLPAKEVSPGVHKTFELVVTPAAIYGRTKPADAGVYIPGLLRAAMQLPAVQPVDSLASLGTAPLPITPSLFESHIIELQAALSPSH